MIEEVVNEINKVISDESLSFISVLERVREILWEYSIESKDYYSVFESLDENNFNDYLYKHMRDRKVDLKKANLFLGDVYSFFSGASDLDESYFSDMYYDTAIEKISSNNISLEQSDIEKANEFINRAISYCAYYMAKVFMSEDFYFGNYTDQEVYDYYTSLYAFGGLARYKDVISQEMILNFISSFESMTKEGFNGKLSKEQYIQILSDNGSSFKETVVGKEVDYGFMPNDGILLMGVDNNVPQVYLGLAMKKAGIKGVFSKSINKSLFCLCNGNIYKHSMNNGQKHNVASVVTDEALNQLKAEVTIMIDSLSSGYGEGTTRGSR